jgi:copper oxidase (laccase) domain-containing protein
MNRGPWTIVNYDLWDDWDVGHTTGYSDGVSVSFQQGSTVDRFLSLCSGNRFYSMEQVHGTEVARTRGASRCYRGVDGLVAGSAEAGLLVRTADCLPVYVRAADDGAEPSRALIHAGWRGLVNGVVPRTLEEFFDGPVELFVGPHIRTDDYEVGDEVIEAVESCLGMDHTALIDAGALTDRDHLDLFQVLLLQLSRIDRVEVVYRSRLHSQSTDPVPLISYRKLKTEDRMLNWFLPPK